MTSRILILAAMVLMPATAARADPPASTPSGPVVVTARPNEKSAAKDDEFHGNPNRVVCRTEDVLGSRLEKRRICQTAAEWANRRRSQRAAIDRAQKGKWSESKD